MPVCFVKASSVGRDFSSSETSMYWVQFDQLTIFSVSLMSCAAAAVFAAVPEAVDPFPALPQAARAAVAPRPRAPVIIERRVVRPRSSAARMTGDIGSGVAIGVLLAGWGSGGLGSACRVWCVERVSRRHGSVRTRCSP